MTATKTHRVLLALSALLLGCPGALSGGSDPATIDGGGTRLAADGWLHRGDAAVEDPCASGQNSLTEGYHWRVGPWSPCSAACGEGTQHREVECVSCSGEPAPEASCPCPAPAPIRLCTAVQACSHTWRASAWGACSASCGGGTRTRTVWCERSDGTKAAQSHCSDSRPPATEACNTHACFTTSCGAMTAWQQCKSAQMPDVYGDPSDAAACAASCGCLGAGCARWVDYKTSAVCVCHGAPGLSASSWPFEPDSSLGYEVFSADCQGTGSAGATSCKTPGCKTSCGAFVPGQQCTSQTYFTDGVHGDGSSAAACAASCGDRGAGCAEFIELSNSLACICHVGKGVGPAGGDLVQGTTKISSAVCL